MKESQIVEERINETKDSVKSNNNEISLFVVQDILKNKRNDFQRINTGGVSLNGQEIRQALYSGKGTELIIELSEREEFKEAATKELAIESVHAFLDICKRIKKEEVTNQTKEHFTFRKQFLFTFRSHYF